MGLNKTRLTGAVERSHYHNGGSKPKGGRITHLQALAHQDVLDGRVHDRPAISDGHDGRLLDLPLNFVPLVAETARKQGGHSVSTSTRQATRSASRGRSASSAGCRLMLMGGAWPRPRSGINKHELRL